MSARLGDTDWHYARGRFRDTTCDRLKLSIHLVSPRQRQRQTYYKQPKSSSVVRLKAPQRPISGTTAPIKVQFSRIWLLTRMLRWEFLQSSGTALGESESGKEGEKEGRRTSYKQRETGGKVASHRVAQLPKVTLLQQPGRRHWSLFINLMADDMKAL